MGTANLRSTRARESAALARLPAQEKTLEATSGSTPDADAMAFVVSSRELDLPKHPPGRGVERLFVPSSMPNPADLERHSSNSLAIKRHVVSFPPRMCQQRGGPSKIVCSRLVFEGRSFPSMARVRMPVNAEMMSERASRFPPST